MNSIDTINLMNRFRSISHICPICSVETGTKHEKDCTLRDIEQYKDILKLYVQPELNSIDQFKSSIQTIICERAEKDKFKSIFLDAIVYVLSTDIMYPEIGLSYNDTRRVYSRFYSIVQNNVDRLFRGYNVFRTKNAENVKSATIARNASQFIYEIRRDLCGNDYNYYIYSFKRGGYVYSYSIFRYTYQRYLSYAIVYFINNWL